MPFMAYYLLLWCFPWHLHPFLTQTSFWLSTSFSSFQKKKLRQHPGSFSSIFLLFHFFCCPALALLILGGFLLPPQVPAGLDCDRIWVAPCSLRSMTNPTTDWQPCTSDTVRQRQFPHNQCGCENTITSPRSVSVFNNLVGEAQVTSLCASEDSTGVKLEVCLHHLWAAGTELHCFTLSQLSQPHPQNALQTPLEYTSWEARLFPVLTHWAFSSTLIALSSNFSTFIAKEEGLLCLPYKLAFPR